MNLNDVPGYLASKLTFHLMSQQAITGIKFDIEGAKQLKQQIEQMMQEIADEVEPQLPPRRLKKSEEKDYTFPAKPFKQDGTLSHHGQAFLERHGLTLIGLNHVEWQGELTRIEGNKQLPATAKMTLANQEDIKAWLLDDCGWVPTLYNFQKDAKGKPVRDKKGKPIPTTPKMQENGRLCPNLELLNGPLVKQVVKWLSLRNRHSVLSGWLENPRLQIDERLSASSSGLAASGRQRHSVVVNLPKADPSVLLGHEMRDRFVASEGNVLVGYDAAALEARVEAHYCMKYKGGEAYAYDLLEGDIHMKTVEAVFANKIQDLIGTDQFHKDHPRVKPLRSKAKSIKYASSYGASPDKLATTIGVSKAEGKEVYDAFWAAAEPLALFKEKLTQYWETTGGKKWIKGIDGRKLFSRSAHSLVNLAFQSCGAIAMDYSGLFMDRWLGGIKLDPCGRPGYLYNSQWIYRVAYMHDEYVWECRPEIAQAIGELGVRSIKKAGEFLKLRVALDGEYKINSSWALIH